MDVDGTGNDDLDEMDLYRRVFREMFWFLLPFGSLEGGKACRCETGTMCAWEKKPFLMDITEDGDDDELLLLLEVDVDVAEE